MRRVVILGRGAAGKSVLAAHLGQLTGLPVVALDERFWRPGLVATPPGEWAAIQRELARHDKWIMDGDLGPYDVLPVRLQAADTVIVLNFSLARCAWRAIRRSRERADFWRWLLGYRRSLPLVGRLPRSKRQCRMRIAWRPWNRGVPSASPTCLDAARRRGWPTPRAAALSWARRGTRRGCTPAG